MISYKVIGSNLRHARLRLDKTQDQVSEMAGLSTTYYGKIERGAIRPNLDRLADISIALGLPIEEVLRGSVHSEKPMNNIDPTNEEFNVFFLKLGGQVSGRLKAL